MSCCFECPRTLLACRFTSPRTAARPRTTSTQTERSTTSSESNSCTCTWKPPPGRSGTGEPCRLLRLVAARQLRVGLRIPEAVRDRVRRLRHPAQDPQGEFGLLRGDREGKRGAAAARLLARLKVPIMPAARGARGCGDGGSDENSLTSPIGSAGSPHSLESPGHLGGQPRISPIRYFVGWSGRGLAAGGSAAARVPDQLAVQAFDLVKPPDQANAVAPCASGEVGERGRLAGRADQHLVLIDHAPVVRARLARLRVHLPGAAPV